MSGRSLLKERSRRIVDRRLNNKWLDGWIPTMAKSKIRFAKPTERQIKTVAQLIVRCQNPSHRRKLRTSQRYQPEAR